MSYLKYVSREFQRSLGNVEIEEEAKITNQVILDNTSVKVLPIAAGLGGTSNRTLQQKAEGRDRVERFVEEYRGKTVMIFTDGSVNSEYSAVGSCAAVLLPLESSETEVKQSEVFSVLADSTEAEVCGIVIALALDMAIQYFSTRPEPDYRESLFILSDCKAAIDIVVNRCRTDGHVHVLSRIRSHLSALRDMMVDVTLAWIVDTRTLRHPL